MSMRKIIAAVLLGIVFLYLLSIRIGYSHTTDIRWLLLSNNTDLYGGMVYTDPSHFASSTKDGVRYTSSIILLSFKQPVSIKKFGIKVGSVVMHITTNCSNDEAISTDNFFFGDKMPNMSSTIAYEKHKTSTKDVVILGRLSPLTHILCAKTS